MISTISEYKKIREFFINSEMPTLKSSRGLQKGVPQLNLELNIGDLLDWYDEELQKNSLIYRIASQEIDLILHGVEVDKFGLYEDDQALQKAYSNSATVTEHSLTSRNVPIIAPDAIKCIESLWFLPSFSGDSSFSYRLSHRSFDIKAAGYTDLLIVAFLIWYDAELNSIAEQVRRGTLYWNINNVTVYVEADGITPIAHVARKGGN